MPFAKLTEAIYDSESCCAFSFLTKNPHIKDVQKFTDASPRAIKKWRADLRIGVHKCMNQRGCTCKQTKGEQDEESVVDGNTP